MASVAESPAVRPTEAALALFREALLDPELRALRENYCRTVVVSLSNVATWLGMDAFLGGGDILGSASHQVQQGSGPTDDQGRHLAFRATSTVVEMAAQLAAGAVLLLDSDLSYAAAALIRQLIEAEYLLTAFGDDFDRAMLWAQATPDEIRRSFSQKKMRTVGQFSNHEYWHHCDMGGHPSPLGRPLLGRGGPASGEQPDVVVVSVWGDLAQHLRRVWFAVDQLLSSEHARYSCVRAKEVEAVQHLEVPWASHDPLAQPVDFALLNDLTNGGG